MYQAITEQLMQWSKEKGHNKKWSQKTNQKLKIE